MKLFLAVIAIAFLAGTARAGQFLGAYNLVPSPVVIPQTYNGIGVIPGVIQAPQQQTDISHPAVVENAIAESQLPPELLNPFYKNPGVASALAKESWFTNKEFLVRHREAEKIPRQEIYKIISRLQHRR
ncbi:uncharacterized protein LOC108903154 [Anoplophora glabripennis]|uniref:uncharacterized protein LOC108903154 n=1 Tax=Anoplophora glabripennis TaxID=217634 RepID=UPI0008735A8C|nr:uncharacterized protein LOC108903154 [Anoplophora glabripennis]